MAYIAISEGGDPSAGKVYSYVSQAAADSSPDIFKEDPVFSHAVHLRDFFAQSDLRLFAQRFGDRIQNWEQLWEALLRYAVPGSTGGTQLSRKKIMSDEAQTEEKVRKPRKQREAGDGSSSRRKELLPVPKVIQKTAVITLLVSENPKRGKSAEVFSHYQSGMTVENFVAAGGTTGDVRWDIAHGYISIDQEEPETASAE